MTDSGSLPSGVRLDGTLANVDADPVPDPAAGRNVDEHRALRDDRPERSFRVTSRSRDPCAPAGASFPRQWVGRSWVEGDGQVDDGERRRRKASIIP